MGRVELHKPPVYRTILVVWIVCVGVQSTLALCYSESCVRVFGECLFNLPRKVGLTLSVQASFLFELGFALFYFCAILRSDS